MFSINIYLRFALIAVCLIGGIALAIIFGFWYAFPFLLIGVALLVGYVIMGTVQSTAQLIHDMKFVEAEKRLRLTFNPSFMYRPNRAYFYLMKGMLELNKKNNDAGEAYFIKAQEIGLQGENEQAMVLLQLANLNGSRGKWNQAKNQYRQIKEIKVTDPNLKDQIKQFEKALANRGVMKGGNTGGYFRPGGKRRRPKMR